MRSINFYNTLTLLISIFLISCEEKKETYTEADLQFSSVQSDQAKWWNYHRSNIDLTTDFLAFGEAGDTISKKQFLEQLVTGKFIAIKVRSNSPKEQYRLYRLDEKADDAIEYTIASDSYREYKHFMMEGQPFPDFHFTDLQGKTYSKQDLLGKTLLVKTWFLRCKPCIEEMPQLNALVEEYKDREDVVFLSLSTDPEDELNNFLTQQRFLYPVVANTKTFVEETLGFNIYPTHIVVDPEGKVIKVVNTAPEMIQVLESHIGVN